MEFTVKPAGRRVTSWLLRLNHFSEPNSTVIVQLTRRATAAPAWAAGLRFLNVECGRKSSYSWRQTPAVASPGLKFRSTMDSEIQPALDHRITVFANRAATESTIADGVAAESNLLEGGSTRCWQAIV